MTRRELLRSAGGLTVFCLVPTLGGFKLSQGAGRLPVFTALPYLQPGPDGGILRPDRESLVVAWQTDDSAADFTVQVIDHGKPIVPTRAERICGDDGELRYNYAARIVDLALHKRYGYRVTMNGKPIAEGWFTTRKPRGVPTRFVAFGDNSFGDISDKMIAYQSHRARPDFIMNTGDNVYNDGTDSNYSTHFFPVYNAPTAHPRIGAPLLGAVPFYTVLGNHDVHSKDALGRPIVNFDLTPDALGFFSNMYLPLNGLKDTFSPPLTGADLPLSHFRQAAGDRFPLMGTYSFDYGDGHFLCLDSNLYIDPRDTALQRYIEQDLKATDAAWKFVVFHHPPFNVGAEHYAEQHMRVLCPLFERCGVDVALHGHEHNYQRTVPMRFAPGDTATAGSRGNKARLIPGRFELDRRFDGKSVTRPEGIVYLTTGAGGKGLYDVAMNAHPEARLHVEDNKLDYISSFVSDRHSLTVFDMDAKSLTFSQIDQWGHSIDTCRLTKKA